MVTPGRTISPEQKAGYARLFAAHKRITLLHELLTETLVELACLLKYGPGRGNVRLQRVNELTAQIHELRTKGVESIP